jgi:hypothetical protein
VQRIVSELRSRLGSVESSLSAATVIWANMVEIAALPNDYLPQGVGDGEVEVIA